MYFGIVAHACQLNACLVDETYRTTIHKLWNEVVCNVSAVHLWISILAQFVHHVLHDILHLYEAPDLIKVANVLHFQFPQAILQFIPLLQFHPFLHDGLVALGLFHYEVVLREPFELSYATEKGIVRELHQLVLHINKRSVYALGVIKMQGCHYVFLHYDKAACHFSNGVFQETVLYSVMAQRQFLCAV